MQHDDVSETLYFMLLFVSHKIQKTDVNLIEGYL